MQPQGLVGTVVCRRRMYHLIVEATIQLQMIVDTPEALGGETECFWIFPLF